jgi:hypothetical protein
LLAGVAALLAGCGGHGGDSPWTVRYADDFVDARNWAVESEQPAKIVARNCVLDIDTPAGLTLWFTPKLEGRVKIEFDAIAVSAGGPNDQVSDLNVFWMARNRAGSDPPYLSIRNGHFALYDDLLTYYVGLGGNRNTTSRFRRYVGEPGNRPLRPEHDLSDRSALLVPNRLQHITLIADGRHIEYQRDGRVLFLLDDPAPYTSGWFAIRTTWSHLRISRLRIHGPLQD